MNIVCPNCDSEYLFHQKEKKLVGQHLQCSNCEQKWFQYNLYNEIKKNVTRNSALKIMAHEEYRISEGHNEETTDDESIGTSDAVKLRLQESSSRLKKSKQRLVENTNEPSEKVSLLDYSAAVGFLVVSLISISLVVLYVYLDKIGELFPRTIGPLANYKLLVNDVIRTVQDLISQSLHLIL